MESFLWTPFWPVFETTGSWAGVVSVVVLF